MFIHPQAEPAGRKKGRKFDIIKPFQENQSIQLYSFTYFSTQIYLFFMAERFEISTHGREALIDITQQVEAIVSQSGIRDGLINVYAQGATAAIMIQENWDDSVQTDVVSFMRKIIPQGVWLHDQQDGNGDAHLKAGLVGPSESIPIIGGALGLSRWQNIFFCEFDGPRDRRPIVCTLLQS